MSTNGAVFTYGRVTVYPGKHGSNDYRVSLAGHSPTLGELIALLASMLKAERRYNGKYELGPYLLWTCIEQRDPLFAKTWEDIHALSKSVDDRRQD